MKAVAGVPERIKRWACTAKLARTLRRAGDSRSASPDGVTKSFHRFAVREAVATLSYPATDKRIATFSLTVML